MVTFSILSLPAILCALGSVIVSVRIANDLRARGKQANPVFVRWMIFKYMADYKRITLEETGKVGPLYNQCATMLILAALFAFAAIMVKIIYP